MSITSQPAVHSPYGATTQAANAAPAPKKTAVTAKKSAPRGHQNGSGLISQSQQKALMKQLMEMMSGFMQTMIKSLMEMFQGMVSSAGSQTTPATPTATEGSPETSSTPTAPQGSGTTETASPNCDGANCDDNANPSTGLSTGTTTSERALEAAVDDKGCVTVLTQDGYSIKCEGKDQAWMITHPDGQVTRIWGDPHVNESDGDTWDFKERSSFIFGKNKVTVETVPAGNGETFSSTITIYNGDERVTIVGLDKNQPVISAVTSDGKVHDAQLADGDLFSLGRESNGEEQWMSNGKAITPKAVAVNQGTAPTNN